MRGRGVLRLLQPPAQISARALNLTSLRVLPTPRKMSCFPCFPAAGASSSAVHPGGGAHAAAHSTSSSAAPASAAPPTAADLHGYEAAFPAAELPERGLKQYVLKANGTALCVVSAGGQLRAIGDLCPHKQGVMSQGDIEDADKAHGLCVKCPRHRKKIPGGLNFRVSDGGSWVADASACEIAVDPAWRVDVHDVRVVGGTVYIAVAPANASPPTAAAAQAVAPPAVAAGGGAVAGSAPAAFAASGGGSRKGSGAGSNAGGGGGGAAADPRAVMAMLSIMAIGVGSSSTDSSAAPSEAAPPSPIVVDEAPLPTPAPLDLSRYERVCALSELPPSGLRRHVLKRSGEAVCVVSHAGRSQLRAIGDVCPHKKAQMSLGDIEDADRGRCGGLSVTCPKHRKRFRQRGLHFSCDDGAAWVTDPGACTEPVDPKWRLPVYDVVVVDGAVYVSAAPQPARTAAAAPAGAGAHSQVELARDVGGGTAVVHSSQRHHHTPTATGDSAITTAAPTVDVTSTAAADEPTGWLPCVIADVERVSADTLIYVVVPAPGVTVPPTPASVDRHSWHVSLGLTAVPTTLSSAAAAAGVASGDAAAVAVALAARAPTVLSVHREYTPLSSLPEWDVSTAAGAAGAGAAQPPVLRLLVKIYPTGQLTSLLGGAYQAGHVVYVSAPTSTLCLPRMLPPDLRSAPADVAPLLATPVNATARPSSGGSAPSESVAPQPLPSPASLPSHSLFGPGTACALVAGGTGVTPMLQLARWALGLPGAGAPAGGAATDSQLRPEAVYLLLSNHSRGDALGEAEVRALAAAAPGRLHVLHTFTRDGSSGSGGSGSSGLLGAFAPDEALPNVRYTTGRVSAAMLAAFLPPPQIADKGASSSSSSSAALTLARVVVSGPNGMMAAVRAALGGAGHHPGCLVELEA